MPLDEQIENSSVYFEPANQTWFLFTNHVGVDARGEYTDGVWVYWSKDLNRWDARAKAVVLDYRNCTWSPDCIGMPTVIRMQDRLALLYDGPGGKSVSHVRRSIGLAWLTLPLVPPVRTRRPSSPSRETDVQREPCMSNSWRRTTVGHAAVLRCCCPVVGSGHESRAVQ